MSDWQTYYNQHLSRSPRPLLIRAVSFCKSRDVALDVGAGTLVESKFLLDSGFKKVVAVDSSSEIKVFAQEINDKRLEVLVNPFQDLVLSSESYDLISAQFALPFYGPKGFEEFIAKLISSLKIGGVFTGQFFGTRDGWNIEEENLAFQTINEAKDLLKALKVEEFTEEEKDGVTASGEAKHWHIFHFITVK
jgi:cyclopropane fatty-acyl-phospholipid synthase-like methyltransferase